MSDHRDRFDLEEERASLRTAITVLRATAPGMTNDIEVLERLENRLDNALEALYKWENP